MPKLVDGIWYLANKVLVACGLAGYNSWRWLRATNPLTHILVRKVMTGYGKVLGFTLNKSQLDTDFYTSYQQLLDYVKSVSRLFVHMFHRAYKETYDSYKGDY